MTQEKIEIYVGENPPDKYDYVVETLQEAVDLAREFPSDSSIVIQVENKDYSPWVAPTRWAGGIPIDVEDTKEAMKLVKQGKLNREKYARALKDKTDKMLIRKFT